MKVKMLIIIVIILIPQVVSAQLTPIARWDVVPYQRIDAGGVFNIGIVAFSKEGIDRVEFSVSGQGYSGTNPLVSDQMILNPRTGVYEYWVPIQADDFATDGPVVIEAVVYGNDGGTRDKNWIIDDVFGATYGLDCWIDESTGYSYRYFCNVTSNGLFSKDLVYSYIITNKSGETWWNGIDELIIQADSNNLTFQYGTTYGGSPTTLDYAPETGDSFIISRGFGLDPLILVVNPQGSLPQPVAYVDVAGDDSTGEVNNPGLPYATTGAATTGIRDWMNSNGFGSRVNGGIIKLNPGEHIQSNGGFWTTARSDDEWLTYTSNKDLGGSKENTKLLSGSSVDTDFIKAEDLNLSAENVPVGQGDNVFSTGSVFYHKYHLWIENCSLYGNTKFSEVSSPVESTHAWYTNSYFTNMGKVNDGGILGRNLTVEHVGDDVFCRSSLAINIYAFDVDPRDGTCVGGGCAHADCWQWWGRPVPHNAIIYGFECINSTYQGLFARTQDGNTPQGFTNPSSEGVAIVNMQTILIPPAAGATNAWYIPVNHMLLWHNSFNHEFNFWNDGDGVGQYPLNIVDFDARGNSFFDVELNADIGDDNGGDSDAPGIELDSWVSNHYLHEAGWEYFSETPGSDVTIGDPMVDHLGRPLEGSPLIDRISPLLVPIDATGNLRTSAGDVGALEYEQLSLQLCSELGGIDCCIGDETCPGTNLGASSDCSGICCSQTCQPPPPTCQNQGFVCCDSCQSEPHPEYDDDCSGQICCGECIPQGIVYSYKTQATVTIDADASEYLDAMAYNIEIMVQGTPTPTDLSGWFKTKWDDDNLYVYVEVTDDSLVNDGDYWDDDTVGIHIDGLNDDAFGMDGDDDLKIALIYNDQLINGKGDVVDPPEWSSLLNSTVITANGYTAEFSIPFSLFGISPAEDYVLGFDIALYDDDDGGMLDHTIRWNSSATTGPYTDEDTSLFGDLILKQSQYHRSDINTNGCVELDEMLAFMDRWKVSIADVSMTDLMESIGLWKSGSSCS